MTHVTTASIVKGKSAALALAAALTAGFAAGCHSDKPHDYGQERPPVGELDERDKGLQSLDIQQAADRMAADLLSHPDLNRSQTRWTIVQDQMKDMTRDRTFNDDYDIFLQAVKVRVIRQSQGRVTWVQNRDEFYNMRNRELEGAGSTAAAPQSTQPGYALTGVVRDLPRRGTIYYQMEFTLQNLNDRTTPWIGAYEVKVAR